jgi:ribosomal protein L37AE/L43A
MVVFGFGPAYGCRAGREKREVESRRRQDAKAAAKMIVRRNGNGIAEARRSGNAETDGKAEDCSAISLFRVSAIVRALFLQRFEGVAVFAVEHGPAGSGEFGAEAVSGFEVFGGFGGPAFFGEGCDFGGGDDLEARFFKV